MPRCLDLGLRAKVEQLDTDPRYGFEERAAILEFDAGLPRAAAEKAAWEQCWAERLAGLIPA
jgi:hypothetical protein